MLSSVTQKQDFSEYILSCGIEDKLQLTCPRWLDMGFRLSVWEEKQPWPHFATWGRLTFFLLECAVLWKELIGLLCPLLQEQPPEGCGCLVRCTSPEELL